MGHCLAQDRHGEAGFSLLEMLLAIALMGLIVAALGTVTAQWLPNWNKGLLRVQRNGQVEVALQRLAADLSVAEYVSANRTGRTPFFRGEESAVTFIRPAVGPNTNPGLEFVQISEFADPHGPLLVRTRAPFTPLPIGDPSRDLMPFDSPVVLLRAPLRIAFAYLGADGKWTRTWTNSGELPRAVRFAVRNTAIGDDEIIAGGTRIHAEMMPPQVDPQADGQQAQDNKGGSQPEQK